MHGKKFFLLALLLLCLHLVSLPAMADSESPFVPLWSRTGDQVLLADSSSINPTFWIVTARTRDWRKAPLAFYPSVARWSPNDRVLAYAAAGQVAFLNPDNLENRMLNTLKNSPMDIRGLAWSPKGDRLAVLYLSPSPAVQVANINGTNASTMILPLPEGASASAMLVWAPDGQSLALMSQGGLWVANLTPSLHPSEWTSLIQDEAMVIDLLWAPDSRRLILTAATDLFGKNMELVLTSADAAYWKPVLSGSAIQAVVWESESDTLLCTDLTEERAGVLTGLTSSGNARVSWLPGIKVKKSTLSGQEALAALILAPDAPSSTEAAWRRFNLDQSVSIRNPRAAGLWKAVSQTMAENPPVFSRVEEIWAFRGEPSDFERLLSLLARGTSSLSHNGRYLALSGSGNTPAQILTVTLISATSPSPAGSRGKNDNRHTSFLFRPVTWFVIMVLLIIFGAFLTIRLRRKKLSPRG